jgi:taurine dioxygenase
MSVTAPEVNTHSVFTPLKSAIGARVDGIDLSRPMSDAVFSKIRAAMVEYGLLLLTDQTLTPEQHIAFSRRFGELEDHVLSNFCLPGHSEIFVVSNIVENGRHIGAHGGSKFFHSDLSYLAEPSLGSVFYCLECPDEGGETAFASMFAAYDALPETRKRWLQGRNVINDYVWNYERNLQPKRGPLSKAQKAKTPPVVQPAVLRHPENGRSALYVSDNVSRCFEGMGEAESRKIIEELTAFATQPEFVYTHKWTPGDVLIWDNRSTVHKACPYDEEGTRRRMHRTTICGERLVAAE